MLIGPGTAVAVPYFGTRDPDSEPSSNLMASVMHAVRRRWMAISVLGLIAACCGATAGWFLIKPQYTAVVRLIIPAGSESLLTGGGTRSEGEFALRKRSQSEIIRGFKVLEQSLGRLDLTKLPTSDFRDMPLEDRLPYLRGCVTTSFPGDAEIMELRVRCLDRRTAEQLATIITEVYLDEQRIEATSQTDLIANLQKTHDEFTKEFRDATDKLARMKQQAQPQAVSQESPAVQAYRNEMGVYFEMKGKLKRDILEAELELDRLLRIQEERDRLGPDAPEEPLVSEAELNEAVEYDQQTLNLRGVLEKLASSEAALKDRYSGKGYETALANSQRERERTERRIADRREQLRHEMEVRKRSTMVHRTPAELQSQLEVLRQKYAQLEQQMPEAPASLTAEQRSGVERSAAIAIAEMERDIVKWKMDQVERHLSMADLAAREAAARDRQTGIRRLDGDTKVYMLDDDDQKRKLMQAGAAGGAAFVAVAGLIILLDVRRRRLNDTGDVSDQLQINVLGTVPLLRGKGPKRLEQSARLAEAVDGVAATLLCRTAGDDHRVVMISSAMAGEGKTTLAANLATSLASAGRRTLLVDFDLRRPMLHQVYQVPIGPGLGELLSGPDLTDYTDYIRETATEGLWLIPAGAKRQRAIAELSDARTAELFAALKEQFEFIIVDGPPVLPVVDTRLVARHADGVVLSLLRDVSELPKVRSACQLLQSYRVRILGGVVIGASGDVYYGEPPERFSSIA